MYILGIVAFTLESIMTCVLFNLRLAFQRILRPNGYVKDCHRDLKLNYELYNFEQNCRIYI